MDSKRKKQYYFIICCIVILISVILYVVGSSIYTFISQSKQSSKILAEFNELYESDETQVILFASPACKWCKKFVPVLDEISEENNFKYYYLNVLNIFESDYDEIKEKLKLDIEGIPYLVVIENKKVKGTQSGAVSKEKTVSFLTELGIIEGGTEDDESVSTGS